MGVGDFNGDGSQDVATANEGGISVSVLLGNGAGGFGPATSVGVTIGSPVSVAVGDVNRDGNQDLVSANKGGNTIAVLLGNGAGGFALAAAPGVGASPTSVALADVNGDGIPDAVTANQGADAVSVLLGDGTGGFGAPILIRANAPNVPAVAVADLNGDGNQDLAFTDPGRSTVSVLLGNGLGSFGAPTPVSVGQSPSSVAPADLDGDGNQDLVTGNGVGSFFSFMRGDGSGLVGPVGTGVPAGTAASVAVGDFNQDGNQDLATSDGALFSVSVFLANGGPVNTGNLLVDPDAEGPGAAGNSSVAPAFAGWTRTLGTPTFVRYLAPGFPTLIDAGRWNGGTNLFAGGVSSSSVAEQTVAVANRAAEIDAGRLGATLSGLLGGSGTEDDGVRVTATFLPATGAPLGRPLTIGPVTAAERKNQSVLLRRQAVGALPRGTRRIKVTMTMTRAAGPYNNALADNLGLRLATITPSAGSRPRCRGKRATIVATRALTRGTARADVIVGRPGRDVIRAGGGNDLVCGGGGPDRIDGGPGADTLLGQGGADRLSGGPGKDLLLGGAGRDLLIGGAGPDLLRGGAGLDRLRGGPGRNRQVQ